MKRSAHKINGQMFEVAFVAGQHWYLRRISDDKLFKSGAVELTAKMHLTEVTK
jgi:hypothetical protein